MRHSALLVVPSRRESFSSVTAEAIACGTPVVATRCGGPEEIITAMTGRLARPEDPQDLAGAIEQVLDHRSGYDPAHLHRHIVSRFGTEAIGRRLSAIYAQALNGDSASQN
jgi:glycosyltransferase involved in cell wall biosynthesis